MRTKSGALWRIKLAPALLLLHAERGLRSSLTRTYSNQRPLPESRLLKGTQASILSHTLSLRILSTPTSLLSNRIRSIRSISSNSGGPAAWEAPRVLATTIGYLSPADCWQDFLPSRDKQCDKGVVSFYCTASSARTTRYGCCTPTPTKGARPSKREQDHCQSSELCLGLWFERLWRAFSAPTTIFHVLISARRSKLRRNIMFRDTRSIWILALRFSICRVFFLCYTFPRFQHDRLAACTARLGLSGQTHMYGEGLAWYTRHGPFNDTFGSSLGQPYDSSAVTMHRRLAC